MNIEKFTATSRALLSDAQMIAAKNNHQQILPLHFLSALLNEENAIISNLINTIGADNNLIASDCAEELERIPSVEISGGGGQINMSSDGLKLLEKVLSLAKSSKDSFATLERIFEAISYDKTAAGKILAKHAIDSKKNSSSNFVYEKRTHSR